MSLILIRLGATQGNLERRYVGRTDEGLCEVGRAALLDRNDPPVELVVVSPMRRCVETAAILYPGQTPILVSDFREMDFGSFEYATAIELSNEPAYQGFIDSGGALPFPEGETREAFSARCASAFQSLMRDHANVKSVAIVAHGGTIMAIMANFAFPSKPYFDWQMPCASAYICDWDGHRLLLSLPELHESLMRVPSETIALG